MRARWRGSSRPKITIFLTLLRSKNKMDLNSQYQNFFLKKNRNLNSAVDYAKRRIGPRVRDREEKQACACVCARVRMHVRRCITYSLRLSLFLSLSWSTNKYTGGCWEQRRGIYGGGGGGSRQGLFVWGGSCVLSWSVSRAPTPRNYTTVHPGLEGTQTRSDYLANRADQKMRGHEGEKFGQKGRKIEN